MNVRTLMASDDFPEGFSTGYEQMPVMKSWVWVAEEDNEVVGVLLAAPMHGLVYLMRICIHDGAKPTTAFLLLRTCMRDAVKRGFKGFFMHINPTEKIGTRMMKLVKRAKGIAMPAPNMMLVGSTETAARF